MSDKKNDDGVIRIKRRGSWCSKWVCKECKGVVWKTVVKGKEYMCRNCGKVNTGVMFIWDAKKKGLVIWVPPPPKPTVAELEKVLSGPDQPIVTLPNGEIRVQDQVPADPNQQIGVKGTEPIDENQRVSVQGVEPGDGVEPKPSPQMGGSVGSVGSVGATEVNP